MYIVEKLEMEEKNLKNKNNIILILLVNKLNGKKEYIIISHPSSSYIFTNSARGNLPMSVRGFARIILWLKRNTNMFLALTHLYEA